MIPSFFSFLVFLCWYMISQFEDNKLHSPYGLVGLANLSKIPIQMKPFQVTNSMLNINI